MIAFDRFGDWLDDNALSVPDAPRVELRCGASGCAMLLARIYFPVPITDGVIALGKTRQRDYLPDLDDEFFVLRGLPGAIKVYACPRHTFAIDEGTIVTADHRFPRRFLKRRRLRRQAPEPAREEFATPGPVSMACPCR